MNISKKYFIRAAGQLVPVTEKIYKEYHKMNRREKYLEECDAIYGKFLYSDMDTDEILGEEMIYDTSAVSVEQTAILEIMIKKLRKYLDLLSNDERELIDALFFSNGGGGMSEREYEAISGVSRSTINARKITILGKLKKMMKKHKSF